MVVEKKKKKESRKKAGVVTARNVNQYFGFRHWQNSSPGSSRMEIYETISHVSTNQVWLHINFASSRVYFRPFTLCSSVLLARYGATYQKLPAWYLLSHPANSCRNHLPYTFAFYRSPAASSPLLPVWRCSSYPCTRYIVNPLSYSSLGDRIPKSPPTTMEHRGAFLIAPRYV